MANVDSVFGARYVGSFQSGSTGAAKVKEYVGVAAYGTALFVGDFVKLAGTAANNEDGISLQSVEQAAAGDTVCGFVVGVRANPDNLNRIYRPASTLQTVYVCDDPYAAFEIQTASATDLTATMIGNNADITVGSGSTTTGLSGMEVDLTTVGTADGQLRILQLIPREDNEYGEHAKVLCMINEHRYKGTVGA
jgi:hypothetical protein